MHLKKEVLNLIGLIYNFRTSKGEFVHVRLNDSLTNLKRQFFPLKSRDLAKNSFQATNFNVIIQSFLNLLLLSKNLKVSGSPHDHNYRSCVCCTRLSERPTQPSSRFLSAP